MSLACNLPSPASGGAFNFVQNADLPKSRAVSGDADHSMQMLGQDNSCIPPASPQGSLADPDDHMPCDYFGNTRALQDSPQAGSQSVLPDCKHAQQEFAPCTTGCAAAQATGTSISDDATSLAHSAPSPDPSPTRSSANAERDFFVRRVLNTSVFGKVLEAYAKSLDRMVAIKLSNLHAFAMRGLSCVENPVREASLMRLLPAHPNIISLYDEIFTDGVHWLVFEHAANGDLYEFATLHAPLPLHVVRSIFRQLTSALVHVHAHGMCHLDVSMENVLLDRALCPKLADFGAARLLPSQGCECEGPGGKRVLLLCDGVQGTRPGKERYMAPEMVQGLPFDGRLVDSFSLGVILFCMLTSSSPFARADPNDHRWSLILEQGVGALLKRSGLTHRVPPLAVHLLDQLLTTADHRWMASDVIQHPWLRDQAAMSSAASSCCGGGALLLPALAHGPCTSS